MYATLRVYLPPQDTPVVYRGAILTAFLSGGTSTAINAKANPRDSQQQVSLSDLVTETPGTSQAQIEVTATPSGTAFEKVPPSFSLVIPVTVR